MIKQICQTCKIEFTKPHNPKRIYKFCSGKCRPAWNKNKKSSNETILKLKASHLGQVAWNKGTIGVCKGIRGEKSHFWKGGITPKNLAIRMSAPYKLWRTSVFERDNYTCQECNVVGGNLNADHIKPFALYPEERLNISNGRTLCVSCHKKTDTYGRVGIFRNVIAVAQE